MLSFSAILEKESHSLGESVVSGPSTDDRSVEGFNKAENGSAGMSKLWAEVRKGWPEMPEPSAGRRTLPSRGEATELDAPEAAGAGGLAWRCLLRCGHRALRPGSHRGRGELRRRSRKARLPSRRLLGQRPHSSLPRRPLQESAAMQSEENRPSGRATERNKGIFHATGVYLA